MYINYHVKIYVLLNFLIFYLEFLERENLFPRENFILLSRIILFIYDPLKNRKIVCLILERRRIFSIRARKNVFDKRKIRVNCVVWMWVVPMP